MINDERVYRRVWSDGNTQHKTTHTHTHARRQMTSTHVISAAASRDLLLYRGCETVSVVMATVTTATVQLLQLCGLASRSEHRPLSSTHYDTGIV